MSDENIDLALRRALDRVIARGKASAASAAADVAGEAAQQAAAVVDEHTQARQFVHGVGPLFVAKTRSPSQFPQWDEIQGKPPLAGGPFDPEDLELDAAQVVTGIFNMARLPVAGPNESSANKLLRSDDPRLVIEKFEVLASEALTAGSFINIYDDAGTIKARLATCSDHAKLAVGFVKTTFAPGEMALIHTDGTNPAVLMPGITSADVGRRLYLSTTPGRASFSPPTAEGAVLLPLGTIVRAGALVAEVLVSWSFQVRTVADTPSVVGEVRKVVANVGDGAATVFVIAHNLSSEDVLVQLRANGGSRDFVGFRAEVTSPDEITLRFGSPPALDAYRCIVIG